MRTDYRIVHYLDAPSFSLSRSLSGSALLASQLPSRLDGVLIRGFHLDDAYIIDVLPLIVTVGAVVVCLNVTPANEITSSFFGSSNSMERMESSRLMMSDNPLKDVSFRMSRTTDG